MLKTIKVSTFYSVSFNDSDIEQGINDELTRLQTEGKTIVSVSVTDLNVEARGPLVTIVYSESSVLTEDGENKYLAS